MFGVIHRHPRVAVLSAVLVLGALLIPPAYAAHRTNNPAIDVPWQFIGKLFTEGLGRAPDAVGFANMQSYFVSNGCNPLALESSAEAMFTGTEFLNIYGGASPTAEDNSARVLAAYRALLNREPDSAGFQKWYGALNSGAAWTAVIRGIADTTPASEFSNLVTNTICPVSLTNNPTYGFGTVDAIQPPAQGDGKQSCANGAVWSDYGSTTQVDLQNCLNSLKGSAPVTLFLAQQQTVYITQYPYQLVVPSNVTVRTAQAPKALTAGGAQSYAYYARIVRDWANRPAEFYSCAISIGCPTPVLLDSQGTVYLSAGAAASQMWFDGQAGVKGWDYGTACVSDKNALCNGSPTVEMWPGPNVTSTFSGNKISETPGWTSLEAFGTADAGPCGGMLIENNLVTNYTSNYVTAPNQHQKYSDGLSVACEKATITGNGVVDFSDTGIILFTAYPAVQTSQVTNNMLVDTGTSAYGGLVYDALTLSTCNNGNSQPSFAGSLFSANSLWTGSNNHIDIAIADGTREWFGAQGCVGYGGTFQNNTSPAGTCTVADVGIAVSGMNGTTVTGNSLCTTHADSSMCPTGGQGSTYNGWTTDGVSADIAVAPDGTQRGSVIQTPYSTYPLPGGCIAGH